MTIRWKGALGCLAACGVLAVLLLSVRWREEEPPRPEQRAVAKGLALRQFAPVAGTDAFRADLSEETSGMSSYNYRTRNVLFIEPTGRSRWLLPDDDHVVDEHSVRSPETPEYDSGHSQALVGFALAKPVQAERGPGELYVFDPRGRQVIRIADGVIGVHGAALAPDNAAAVLYQKAGGYVLANFDIATLKKNSEAPVEVPILK